MASSWLAGVLQADKKPDFDILINCYVFYHGNLSVIQTPGDETKKNIPAYVSKWQTKRDQSNQH